MQEIGFTVVVVATEAFFELLATFLNCLATAPDAEGAQLADEAAAPARWLRRVVVVDLGLAEDQRAFLRAFERYLPLSLDVRASAVGWAGAVARKMELLAEYAEETDGAIRS